MYFCVVDNPWYDNEEEDAIYNKPKIFIITDEEAWDKKRAWDGGTHFSHPDFYEHAECHYAHEDVDAGRATLVAQGHTENPAVGANYP